MGLGQSAVFEVRQALEWRCGRRWLNGPLVGRQNIVSCILAKWKSVQLDWKPGSCSPYHRFAYKRHSSTWKLSIIARHLIRLLLLLFGAGGVDFVPLRCSAPTPSPFVCENGDKCQVAEGPSTWTPSTPSSLAQHRSSPMMNRRPPATIYLPATSAADS